MSRGVKLKWRKCVAFAAPALDWCPFKRQKPRRAGLVEFLCKDHTTALEWLSADRELGSCHTLIRRQSIDMDSGLASNTGHERMQLDSYLRRTALLIYQCLLPPKVLLSGEIHEVMVRTPVMQLAGRMQRHTPYRLCTYDSPAIGARSWSEI